MHFENGAATACRDLTPDQEKWPCTDMNTTDLLRRLIDLEQPSVIHCFSNGAGFVWTEALRQRLSADPFPSVKRVIIDSAPGQVSEKK